MRLGRRNVALVLAAVAAVASGAVAWLHWGEYRLPPRIRLVETVADLAQPGDGSDAFRVAGLQPGWNVEQGGYRRALVVSPPSTLRFRVAVPPDGHLRFGVGVEPAGHAVGRDAAGVRFAVLVDGRERFTRTVNPARRRDDRRWFDAEIPLGDAGRDVEIALRTERAGGGEALAGTPGWSRLGIVRETSADRQRASAASPSVLVLLVDTLRADRLGCYGSRDGLTPTVDALAERGLVFEDMVSQSSWTLPSVATLLTGLHPRSHGVVGRSSDPAHATADADPAFLPDTLATLPLVAERAGVTTVAVSANPTIAPATNFGRGFETFVEMGWNRKEHNWPGAADVNRRFVGWLARNRRYRFLAYLHYMEPHDPYTPSPGGRPAAPPGVRRAVAAGDIDDVARKLNWAGGPSLPPVELAHVRTLYGLEVRDWDRELADLLASLDRLGVRESTIVVVLGDHGEEFQEHGRLKHGIHLYDELLRVPLVIAGPGVRPGRVTEQAQMIDVFPTVAALLGVPAPPGLPGQDLLRPRAPRPAFAETRAGIAPDGRPTELVSVRADGWKLIVATTVGRSELYDLGRDPGERLDLFGQAPEGARLAALLASWEAVAPEAPAPGGRDPHLTEKLRALGYVE